MHCEIIAGAGDHGSLRKVCTCDGGRQYAVTPKLCVAEIARAVDRANLAVGPGVLPITITRPTAIYNRAVVAGKARVALALASQATAAPVACVCMCARVGVCACVCVSLNHIYTSASSSSILPFTKNSEKVSKPNRSSEGVYVCVHSD